MRAILRLMLCAGVLAAAGAGLTQPAGAALTGDTYSNAAHEVVVSRPDGSWELREGIPIPAAVAAFVVGEGTAAAVLLHWRLDAQENITDAEDFLARRDRLAQAIAAAATGDAGEVTVTASEFAPQDDRVRFVVHFENRDFERGALENLVTGFIVRRADDRQHVFAVRCATTRGTLEAWQSQFDRINSTLAYTGALATPLYTARPRSGWWWWAAGGAIIAVLLFFGRRSRPEHERQRVRTFHERAALTAPLPEPIAPVNLDSSPEEALNVPDMFRPTGGHPDGPAAPTAHPEIAGGGVVPSVAPAEAAEMTQPHVGTGYWTCTCGRKNSDTDAFCWRCNADRAPSE